MEKVNEKLKPLGGMLGVGFGVVGNTIVARLLLQTRKRDASKRKPLPVVYCHFCPFCGEDQRISQPEKAAAELAAG
jgi:hypothetical protein